MCYSDGMAIPAPDLTNIDHITDAALAAMAQAIAAEQARRLDVAQRALAAAIAIEADRQAAEQAPRTPAPRGRRTPAVRHAPADGPDLSYRTECGLPLAIGHPNGTIVARSPGEVTCEPCLDGRPAAVSRTLAKLDEAPVDVTATHDPTIDQVSLPGGVRLALADDTPAVRSRLRHAGFMVVNDDDGSVVLTRD